MPALSQTTSLILDVMNLILCMAGIYRRFREAGYDRPKYLLPWGEATVLDAVIAGLLHDGAFTCAVLIANQRDESWAEAIRTVMGRHGIPTAHLVFTTDTAGQADTGLIGLAALERLAAPVSGPIVFHNVDTILLRRDWHAVAASLAVDAGWIDTFDADSTAYSYVAVDPTMRITAIAEKVAISRLATSGLYAFAKAKDYQAACARSLAERGERYISGVYRTMLEDGACLRAGRPGPSLETLILGTPAEYEAARKASG